MSYSSTCRLLGIPYPRVMWTCHESIFLNYTLRIICLCVYRLMKVVAKVRRVGNSLSIIIPAEEAKSQQINEGDVIQIEIHRKIDIKDLFGSVKFSKSAQQMKDEDRNAWGK